MLEAAEYVEEFFGFWQDIEEFFAIFLRRIVVLLEDRSEQRFPLYKFPLWDFESCQRSFLRADASQYAFNSVLPPLSDCIISTL
jgi:hypothetical protein